MYWLLFSHIMALYPCVICFKQFKSSRGDLHLPYTELGAYQACYTGMNICATAIFSVFYHTYDYNSFPKVLGNYDIWSALDYWASPNTIVTTILYVSRIRSELFYCISYASGVLFLISIVASSRFMDFMVVFTGGFICLIRMKILWMYIKNFLPLTAFGTILLIGAGACYAKALSMEETGYEVWHSLWHFLIFCSAGVFCHLRAKLDYLLAPAYSRAPADSI